MAWLSIIRTHESLKELHARACLEWRSKRRSWINSLRASPRQDRRSPVTPAHAVLWITLSLNFVNFLLDPGHQTTDPYVKINSGFFRPKNRPWPHLFIIGIPSPIFQHY